MDISRFRRFVGATLLNCRNQFGILATIALTSTAVISRVVDRNEDGRWVFWQKAYLPDGYNYILQAVNNSSLDSKLPMLMKLEALFPGSAPISTEQSVEVINTLNSRPIYPMITGLFLNLNFEIAPLIGPIISWLVLNILVYYHTRKKHGEVFALLIVAVFSSSFYMRFNFLGTTTDALSALFTYMVFHYLLQTDIDFLKSVLLNLFLCLAILTRPLDPIFLALIIGVTFANWRDWRILIRFIFPIALLVSHLVYIQLKYQQLNLGTVNTGGEKSGSYLEYLMQAALLTPKVVFVEFCFIVVNDPLLFSLLCYSFFLVLLMRSRALLMIYLILFLSTFYLASLNGTLGNGFRYQLPIVMFSLVVIQMCDSPKNVCEKIRNHNRKVLN